MKKLLGYTFICVAIGMIIMAFLPVNFWTVTAIILLLIAGYNLFCCFSK